MTMNSRKTLEKKQLKSLFWRSFTTSHAWHYERQQHMSFEFAMIPVINKLYDKEEDRIDAYKRWNSTTVRRLCSLLSVEWQRRWKKRMPIMRSSIPLPSAP